MGADISGGTEVAHRARRAVSIKMTHSADEARIVPAEAQGLQETIPGVNLEVAAVAFGAEHLLII